MHLQERVVSNDIFRIFISGNANLVSFIDYLAGRRTGIYWPVLPPTYQKKNNETNNNRNKVDYLNIMSEEAWRQYIRQKIGALNLTNNSNLFQKYFGE
jgi:hypothetical protein